VTALLSIRDLHVYLGESHVLQGVTFDVPEGGVTALLGRNGVGKTTTLRAVMGLTGRRGRIDFEADPFIGFDESLGSTPQERWLARIAPERCVVFRCNSTASLHAAARVGVGVAVLPCFVADRDPELVALEAPDPVHHELWLLVHGDLRRSPPVRAVIDWVDDLVERARPALLGRS
jgi:DNA-binding transcriptional LysR family regulator